MKEHPILMSGEMVRAILDGRKSETRRLRGLEDVNENPDAWTFKKLADLDWMTKKSFKGRFGAYFESEQIEPRTLSVCPQAFPYGRVGDRLWVKETFVIEWYEDEPKAPSDRPIKHYEPNPLYYEYDSEAWLWPHYRATDPAPELFYEDATEEPYCRWRPSIFMPRWASRINLEILNVRVERLHDITEAGVLAEGIRQSNSEEKYWLAPLAGVPDFPWNNAISAYVALWNSINEKSGHDWNLNKWVWVVEFKRV